MQDEIFMCAIWGKNSYYEKGDKQVLRLVFLFLIPSFLRILKIDGAVGQIQNIGNFLGGFALFDQILENRSLSEGEIVWFQILNNWKGKKDIKLIGSGPWRAPIQLKQDFYLYGSSFPPV